MDSLQGGAIQQMMSQLDPHSVYLPPVELKEANEELSGNFEGIGVEFNIFSDTVNIVYVVPDGPSDQAGLKIGDKILKVNDSSLTVKGIYPVVYHHRRRRGRWKKPGIRATCNRMIVSDISPPRLPSNYVPMTLILSVDTPFTVREESFTF